MNYAKLAELLGQSEQDVLWDTWLGVWRLVGLWENNPAHIRAMVMKP